MSVTYSVSHDYILASALRFKGLIRTDATFKSPPDTYGAMKRILESVTECPLRSPRLYWNTRYPRFDEDTWEKKTSNQDRKNTEELTLRMTSGGPRGGMF